MVFFGIYNIKDKKSYYYDPMDNWDTTASGTSA